MEALEARWYPEQGMVDELGFIQQWELESLEDLINQQVLCSPPSLESFNSSIFNTLTTNSAKPYNTVKASSRGSSANISSSSLAPSIISFGKHDSQSDNSSFYAASFVEDVKANNIELGILLPHCSKRKYNFIANEAIGAKKVKLEARPVSNQEHIIAERKRREKLSQKFIALSTIIPGLKKMDKASVLGDAIKHIKQLQEKVSAFEDENAKKKLESAVFVKRSKICAFDDEFASDDNFEERQSLISSLLEIEVRVSNKTVLVKIQCENIKGFVVKALGEIEQLNLRITNTTVIPLTSSTLDITIVAQMEEELTMTAKDLLKKLNLAFKQFI